MRALQPEHVVHGVPPRCAPDQPGRPAHRAAGEQRAGQPTVQDLRHAVVGEQVMADVALVVRPGRAGVVVVVMMTNSRDGTDDGTGCAHDADDAGADPPA